MKTRQVRKWTAKEIAEIERLSLAGLGYRSIGKRVGRSASSTRIKLLEKAILDEIAESGSGRLVYRGWRPTLVETI